MLQPRKAAQRFPLHIHITTLFVALILLVGGTLSIYNYARTSEIILNASDKLFGEINDQLTLQFRETYLPVARTVDLLTYTNLSQSLTLRERSEQLPLLAEALVDKPWVTAIAAGYENGDYFIVRAINNEQIRQTFKAPKEARLLVDQISEAAGSRTLQRFFFDPQMKRLGEPEAITTEYDPRLRPWYRQAISENHLQVTPPYFYYFIKQVGITLSRRSADKSAVIAADVTLNMLSEAVAQSSELHHAEIALLDDNGRVLAYRDSSVLTKLDNNQQVKYATLKDLNNPVFGEVARELPNLSPGKNNLELEVDGQQWIGKLRYLNLGDGIRFRLLVMIPEEQLLADAFAMRKQSALITVIILILSIPLVWLTARAISNPLRKLSEQAAAIRRFELEEQPEVRSLVREVDDLGAAMSMMRSTVTRFLTLLHTISEESDFDALIRRVGAEMLTVSDAKAVAIHLVNDDDTLLHCVNCQNEDNIPLNLPENQITDEQSILTRSVRSKQHHQGPITEQDPSLQPLLEQLDSSAIEVLVLPMLNRRQECIGTLTLAMPTGTDLSRERLAFISEFSNFASMTLESRHLVKMQKALLESFVELIAQTIDAKSPYTGGHCQRVPALTALLANAACQSNEPIFKEFSLSDEEWEALHIASWMHDCGKVTTPEHIVDKATRLETIYNRIHEVRTRFEVLKRDAQIASLEQRLLQGDQNKAEEEQKLQARLDQLDQDFCFVAKCNDGDHFMSDDDLKELNRIADYQWQRTLDDRLGLSWEELQRRDKQPIKALPVTEKLLSDKAEQRIPQRDVSAFAPGNQWGFKMAVPQDLSNTGELHNLTIRRGTLTAEDRFRINDHIVQTIRMLEALPYPKHLKQIPVYAGGHHEKMDGSGYPRGLTREQMPLPARIMAIADIFEALTAADRPYKKAKTLSEALQIMAFMRDDQHIDAELFDLFLTSGVYREYANMFLDSEQIDAVEIEKYRLGHMASHD